MADNKPTKELPERVLKIAREIRGLCLGIGDDFDEMLGYKDQMSKADQRVGETRLDICAKVAKLSHEQKWETAELDVACAQAKVMAMGNRPADDKTAKTVGVFCSQMRAFAHPRVRAHFPVILTACTQAWNTEGEQTEGEKPIRKFKSRLYNLVNSAAVAVKSGEVSITSPADVVQWATDNDPDYDEDKIESRLRNVGKLLSGISADFGDPKIALVCEYLDTITAKQLKSSRDAMKRKQAKADADRLAGHKLADVKIPMPAADEDEDENEDAPAEGAFDLAAQLNDLDENIQLREAA
jgi:hypothetical protein